MLILDVFSASSSFALKTNRTASSEIDLNKIKTLKALKEVFMFSSCRTEIHQSHCEELMITKTAVCTVNIH